MCFSHIQVKLTHVIQKCSTGPQIIFFVTDSSEANSFNWTSDYIFCEVFPSSLSQQYVVKGDATLHSHRLL